MRFTKENLSAVVLSLVFLLGLAGCGPKAIKQESLLDTPQSHYQQGKRLVDQGRYNDAMREFQRSKALNPEYAPAYEGIGLVNLAQGNLKAAEENMKESKDKDKKFAPARIGLGRVYTAMKKYNDALDEFKGAIKIDPKSTDAYIYMGEAYAGMERYSEAEDSYKKALDIDPSNAKADAAWSEMNRLKRAMTGAPPEYAAIAKSKAITRADLSALFVSELPLDKIFRKPPQAEESGYQAPTSVMGKRQETKQAAGIPDIEGNWAKSYIEKAIEFGVISLFPDNTFRPNDKVSKADFAMLVQNILAEQMRDPGLKTRSIGSTSPFPDVPGSHWAFNAISVVTSRGIMKAGIDGRFGPDDTVSGTDALLSIRILKDQLR